MEASKHIGVEQQIRQLNDEWVKALVRGDGETLNRIMADDFILTYPLEGDDKADFIGGVSSGGLQIKHLRRAQVRVRVFCPTDSLMARAEASWLYHGREIFGRYKDIMS